MTKKTRRIITIGTLLILAAAVLLFIFRPAQLSTTQDHYAINGMSANIQGKASQTKNVLYRVNQGRVRSSSVRSGSFSINLPADSQEQRVVIYNHGKSKQVTIASAAPLADYQRFANQYNQALVASRLPKKMTEAAQNPARDPKDRQRQAAQLAAAMAKVQTNSQKELLPVRLNNTIFSLPSHKDYQLRLNIRQQQLIGLTITSPLSKLSQPSSNKTFANILALIAQASGANPKKVLTEFAKTARHASHSQQTRSLPTIRSQGVRFSLGLSTRDLYIYISK